MTYLILVSCWYRIGGVASGSVNTNVTLLPLSVILTEIKIKLVSVSVKTQFEDLLCFSPSLLYCVYILLIPFIIMQFGLVFHQSIFSNSNFKKILFFQMVNTH